MKVCSFLLLLTTLLQICSNAWGEEESCMSTLQLIDATNTLCKRERDNKVLWQQVIDCHQPISDEFMRKSGEAQCPIPKYVENPTNTAYPIQDVFFNICGLVNGGFINQVRGGICFLFGKSNPPVMPHLSTVSAVKTMWGKDVPCNIGKCILKLGLNITTTFWT